MYQIVTTVQGIKDYIGTSTIIAFDIETAPDDAYRDVERAALDPHKAHIVGISFSVEEGSGIYVPIAHREPDHENMMAQRLDHICTAPNSQPATHTVPHNADPSEIMEYMATFLTDTTITKVAQNISFESAFFYAKGIIIQSPVYDTIATAQMTLKSATEFRGLGDSGLKTLVPTLLGENLPTFEEVTGGRHFDELNPSDPETIRYACADSDYTLRLYHLFNGWFDKFLPKHRYIVEEIESPTAVYVGLMRYNGLLADRDSMVEKRQEAEDKLAELRSKITFLIGDVDIGANCGTQAFKDYLFKDLGLPVLKTTAKYKEAADDETMILLADWCAINRPDLAPLFDLVTEYRRYGKLLSTYIDGYLKFINPTTGRIHPDLFPLGAASGRFSCRKPNLQNQSSNLPINVREFFVAPAGHVLIEHDFGQIELRCAAYLSGDMDMKTAYQQGEDIHALTTAAVFGVPLCEAGDKSRPDYKKRRTVAKSAIFGVLYGIYKKGLQRNLRTSAGIDLTVDECDTFIKNIKAHYTDMTKWQDETVNHARLRRYAETRLGRRRYVSDITSTDFVKRGGAERAALNHGVQGLAADVLKLSMARLLPELSHAPWLKPVLTVHDSLVFYAPADRVSECAALIKRCMEAQIPLSDFDVPLIAEASVGTDYGHMKELE